MRHGVLGGRWKVLRRLGKGGFAEVYEVEDLQQPGYNYALKIADTSKDNTTAALRAEHKALQKLHELGCRHLVMLLPEAFAEHGNAGYFLMELAGANMADLQPVAPMPRWDTPVLLRACLQALAAIESIHKLGYLHRDIKPANYVIFPQQATAAFGEWRLLDFGTCRRWKAADGSVIPERQNYHEFRGSTSYASVNAHLLRDLGRVDDLWSWLYLCVELWEGRLPWRRDHATKELPPDKDAILELKRRCQLEPAELMSTAALPDGFREISGYLTALEFSSEPDYDLLRTHLATLAPAPDRPQNAGSTAGSAAPAPAAAPSAQPPTSGPSPASGAVLQGGHGGGTGQKRGREIESEKRARNRRAPEQEQGYARTDHEWQHANGHASSELADAGAAQSCVEAFVSTVQQGDLSNEAWKACSQLASLDPAEGLGVMAWILHRIASCAPSGSTDAVAPWIEGFGVYAQHCAQQCRGSVRTRDNGRQ